MSRGGFRGRGRGGPPGLPAFNSRDYMEAMAKANKHGGQLYPPLESRQLAYLSESSDAEAKAVKYALEVEDILSRGHGDEGTPWRLAAERKSVGIEIESYSDRKKPPASSGPTVLDPSILYMDQSLFPPILWKEYFEGQATTGKKDKGKKRKKMDDDSDQEAEEKEASAEESVTDDSDFDDDDGSDHQDYEANYFDNGEDDDDSGGEEEDGNNGGGGNDD